MLQIIKFLFLSLDIFLKQCYLLPGLEIIIRNVQLKQNALPFNRLFPEAVQLAVFRHFIIDVGSDLLQVFLTLVTAQSKDLPAYDYFRICLNGHRLAPLYNTRYLYKIYYRSNYCGISSPKC